MATYSNQNGPYASPSSTHANVGNSGKPSSVVSLAPIDVRPAHPWIHSRRWDSLAPLSQISEFVDRLMSIAKKDEVKAPPVVQDVKTAPTDSKSAVAEPKCLVREFAELLWQYHNDHELLSANTQDEKRCRYEFTRDGFLDVIRNSLQTFLQFPELKVTTLDRTTLKRLHLDCFFERFGLLHKCFLNALAVYERLPGPPRPDLFPFWYLNTDSKELEKLRPIPGQCFFFRPSSSRKQHDAAKFLWAFTIHISGEMRSATHPKDYNGTKAEILRRPEDDTYVCKITKDLDRDPKDIVFDSLFDLLQGLANNKIDRERPFTEAKLRYQQAREQAEARYDSKGKQPTDAKSIPEMSPEEAREQAHSAKRLKRLYAMLDRINRARPFEPPQPRQLRAQLTRGPDAEKTLQAILDYERNAASVNRDSLGMQRYAMELAVLKGEALKITSMSADLFPPLNEWPGAMYLACYYGKTAVVEHLISLKCLEDDKAVECAVDRGHMDLMRFFHARQKIPPSQLGWRPVNTHAQRGNLEIVKFLIEQCSHPADSIFEADDLNPAECALKFGHLAVAEYFLSKKAPPRVQTPDSTWPALHDLAARGDKEGIEFLLKANCTLDTFHKETHQFPLEAAVNFNQLGVVKFYESLAQEPTRREGWYPVHHLALHGHVEMVKILLKRNFDVAGELGKDLSGRLPVEYAVDGNCVELVKIFVKDHNTLPVPRAGWHPLHALAAQGFFNPDKDGKDYMIEELLRCGHAVAEVKESEKRAFHSAFHAAIKSGKIELVKYLFERSKHLRLIDIVSDEEGATPYELASDNSREIRDFLFNQGARPRATKAELQAKGITLHSCAKTGDGPMAQYMVETLKCDITERDDKQLLPVQYALRAGHIEVARFLLSQIESAKELNSIYDTALATALSSQQFSELECLLRIYAANASGVVLGSLPLHDAVRIRSLSTVKLLIDIGYDLASKDVLIVEDGREIEHQTALHVLAQGPQNTTDSAQDDKTCVVIARMLCVGDSKYGPEPATPKLEKKVSPIPALPPALPRPSLAPGQDAKDQAQVEPVTYIDINTTDANGETPLHSAARAGYPELCQFYVKELKASILKDKNGQTPVHEVSKCGNHVLMQFFVEKCKADLRDIDKDGKSVLQWAVECEKQQVIDYLTTYAFFNTIGVVEERDEGLMLRARKLVKVDQEDIIPALVGRRQLSESLASLDLSATTLRYYDGKFRHIFQCAKKLTALDVSNCGIGDEAVREILTARQQLHSLNLSRNRLSSKILHEIVKFLTHNSFYLAELNLSNCGFFLPAALQLQHAVKVHPRLERLLIGTDREAQSVIDQALEQPLSLAGLGLSDDDLKLKYPTVPYCKRSKIDLSNNELTSFPSYLFTPQMFHNLTSLDLSNNKISTLPLDITRFAHLEMLNLEFNQFNLKPQALPGNLCVTLLRGNECDDRTLMSSPRRDSTVVPGADHEAKKEGKEDDLAIASNISGHFSVEEVVNADKADGFAPVEWTLAENAKGAVVTRYAALTERHVHIAFDVGKEHEAKLKEVEITIPEGRSKAARVVAVTPFRHWPPKAEKWPFTSEAKERKSGMRYRLIKPGERIGVSGVDGRYIVLSFLVRRGARATVLARPQDVNDSGLECRFDVPLARSQLPAPSHKHRDSYVFATAPADKLPAQRRLSLTLPGGQPQQRRPSASGVAMPSIISTRPTPSQPQPSSEVPMTALLPSSSPNLVNTPSGPMKSLGTPDWNGQDFGRVDSGELADDGTDDLFSVGRALTISDTTNVLLTADHYVILEQIQFFGVVAGLKKHVMGDASSDAPKLRLDMVQLLECHLARKLLATEDASMRKLLDRMYDFLDRDKQFELDYEEFCTGLLMLTKFIFNVQQDSQDDKRSVDARLAAIAALPDAFGFAPLGSTDQMVIEYIKFVTTVVRNDRARDPNDRVLKSEFHEQPETVVKHQIAVFELVEKELAPKKAPSVWRELGKFFFRMVFFPIVLLVAVSFDDDYSWKQKLLFGLVGFPFTTATFYLPSAALWVFLANGEVALEQVEAYGPIIVQFLLFILFYLKRYHFLRKDDKLELARLEAQKVLRGRSVLVLDMDPSAKSSAAVRPFVPFASVEGRLQKNQAKIDKRLQAYIWSAIISAMHCVIPGAYRAIGHTHPFFGEESWEIFVSVSFIWNAFWLALISVALLHLAAIRFKLDADLFKKVGALTDHNKSHQEDIHLFLDLNSAEHIDFWMALRKYVKQVPRPRYVTSWTKSIELPTRTEASFCAMLILLLDVVIFAVLFVRVLILKKDFDMLTLLGVLQLVVLTVLIVRFMLKIVAMNEAAQHDHLEILESQRYRFALRLKQVSDQFDFERTGQGSNERAAQSLISKDELEQLTRERKNIQYTLEVLDSAVAELRDLDVPFTILFVTIDKQLIAQVVIAAVAGALSVVVNITLQ